MSVCHGGAGEAGDRAVRGTAAASVARPPLTGRRACASRRELLRRLLHDEGRAPRLPQVSTARHRRSPDDADSSDGPGTAALRRCAREQAHPAGLLEGQLSAQSLALLHGSSTRTAASTRMAALRSLTPMRACSTMPPSSSRRLGTGTRSRRRPARLGGPGSTRARNGLWPGSRTRRPGSCRTTRGRDPNIDGSPTSPRVPASRSGASGSTRRTICSRSHVATFSRPGHG